MKEYLAYSCLIILVYCMTGIHSQLGPIPPRFAIQGGALASPVRQPIQYRNERLVSGVSPNGPFLRVRRPVLPPPARANTLQPFQAQNTFDEDAKPVTEENESAETPSYIASQQPYIPQIQTLQQHQHQHQHQHQPQSKPQLPAVLYTTDENGEVLEQHRSLIDFSTTPRFAPSPIAEIQPTTIRTTGNAQRFLVNQDHPVQSALQGTTKPPLRARPEYREPRPHFEAKELAQPVRRPQQNFDFTHVKPRPHHDTEEREKKPVAQILRKYREENEDGTITWGFENDDGSFKEEIIGNDCVTRGRYGYIDPDGVKREYNYETGNACDPNKRDLEDAEEDEEQDSNRPNLQDNGAYVDYQENQMVLPNGQRYNLNNSGKNKARRPNFQNN